MAQTVKPLPKMWKTQVQSLGQEDPLEKEMATHFITLDWKIPWTEEPGRLQAMGLQRVGYDWATSLSHFSLYHYRVEVRNRLKELYLIECLVNYGRRFVTWYRRQRSRPSPRRRNTKNQTAVWGGLTNSCEKKWKAKEKRKDICTWIQDPKNSKER